MVGLESERWGRESVSQRRRRRRRRRGKVGWSL